MQSSIIDIWQSSKFASGILQNSHSKNHLCWRPFCSEIVGCVCNVTMRTLPQAFSREISKTTLGIAAFQKWTASAFTRSHVSAFLIQFFLKSTFTSQILKDVNLYWGWPEKCPPEKSLLENCPRKNALWNCFASFMLLLTLSYSCSF